MRFPCFALIFVSCFFAPEFVQKLRQSRKRLFPVGHWNNIENRKNFFMSFAEKSGINPLNPAQWQRVTSAQIKAKEVTNPPPTSYCSLKVEATRLTTNVKGGRTILALFKTLPSALEKTFPELEGKLGTVSY